MRRTPLADISRENRRIPPSVSSLPILQEFAGASEEIIRQIRENLFFLSHLRSPEGGPALGEAQISCYLDVARWYVECTADENGMLKSRRFELNSNGNPEPVANHPLRTVDIGLGLFDRMQHTPEVASQEWFRELERHILEFCLIMISHDCFEEQGKFYGRTSRKNLQEKLDSSYTHHLSAISSEEKAASLSLVTGSVGSLSILDEEKANGGIRTYLHRNWQNPFCRYTKSADIIQNALSRHTKNQEQKYREHYVRFLLDSLSFNGFRSADWLNPNLINRMMRANPYLKKVFRDAGHEGWEFRLVAGIPMSKYPN